MKHKKTGFTPDRRGEKGSILAISGIAMLALMLAVGLGVDISRFYLAKTELQNAADAAALAGVSALNSSATGVHEAVDRAVLTMNSYDFNKTGVSFPRENVKFSKNLGGAYVSEALAAADPKLIRFVEVTTPSLPVGISFAATVLGNSKDMSATATAGFSFPLNTVCNWFPAFVLDLPDAPISKGNDYIFRMEPGGHVSPGNYQLLAPADPGGADTRTGMANGVDVCTKVGDIVPTKPGVTAGDVRQGINSRFDIYQSTLDPATSPPDKNIATGISWTDYRDKVVVQAPRNEGVDGRRIIIMPIVKTVPGDGRDEVQVDRFGKFWLKEPVGGGNGAELIAYYIDNTILPGRGTFDPSGGAFDPDLAVPVLYK